MGSEWQEVTIAELAAQKPGSVAVGPFGSRMKSNLYTETGIRVIRGNNLGDGQSFKGDFVHVASETADSMPSCCVSPGDLVFPHRGNIGEVGIVPADSHRYMLSTSLMKLSPDRVKVDPLFLFYFFKSEVGRQALLMNASQVGTPGISTPLKSLKEIRLRLPDLAMQGRIIELLSVLDDKITLLRETNATLEAIAQAIFKSWFVDFDPVRAKAEGRDPEGVPPEVADLFPSEFEDSELGAIPKGWRAIPFIGAIEVIGGGTPKTSVEAYWNGDIPWFSVVDAPRDGDVFVLDTEKHITAEGVANSSTRMLRPGTTIISARGTVGKTALVGREMAMNQSCYGLQGRRIGDAQTYFATRRLVSELRQRSHGSVFETITRDTLASVSVVVASQKISEAFESFVGTLLARVKNNVSEAATLANLRDTLLPRLMSGKFRIPD